MPSSLPTLRPYPWNPPMTCIYTGHPSAWSLSSLPRPWSCWGFTRFQRVGWHVVCWERSSTPTEGGEKTPTEMWNVQRNLQNHAVYSCGIFVQRYEISRWFKQKHTCILLTLGFFQKQKVNETTLHLVPQKSDTNHQEKNHSQKPVSLEKLGKLVAIVMASFFWPFLTLPRVRRLSCWWLRTGVPWRKVAPCHGTFLLVNHREALKMCFRTR